MGAALLMAIALSLDGFGVGLTYGLRRIRIPFASMLVIALCTVLAMSVSMLFGHWVKLWLRFFPANWLGAAILFGLGIFQLQRALREDRESQDDEAGDAGEGCEEEAVPVMSGAQEVIALEPVLKIDLRFFGLVIQVLRRPAMADMDGSGGISLRESVLLGSALAMDAFASGIGAALAGMNLSVVVIVALTQMIILQLGQALAGKVPETLLSKVNFLPGTVLILIGLGKLF